MRSTILDLGEGVERELGQARAIGFDRFLYTVEALHGVTSQPIQIMGSGWSAEYLPAWLERTRQDPLRRMVARGEVPLSNLPIAFENSGSSLSLPHSRRLSAGEISLLRWAFGQGVRTGVSMAVRMPRGLYATVNFYAPDPAPAGRLAAAVERLFLLGHRVHAHVEQAISRSLQRAPELGLSRREMECLEWIARGKTNEAIADILGVSAETAKEYTENLFRKLQVGSRAQAVARGFALGYLS